MLKREFSLICFDLDGTLADTSEGIYAAYTYACSHFGITEAAVRPKLSGVIGSKPIDVFRERFDFDQRSAEAAIGFYRNYYEKHGIYRAYVYPGIEDCLIRLKEKDYLLAVTTLKYQSFAEDMLAYLGIAKYFNAIFGCGADNKDTKAMLIEKAMASFQSSNAQTILIGDSAVDALGAKLAGVSFAGVTYGLGFRTAKEVDVHQPYLIVNNTTEFMSHF